MDRVLYGLGMFVKSCGWGRCVQQPNPRCRKSRCSCPRKNIRQKETGLQKRQGVVFYMKGGGVAPVKS